MPSGSPTPPDAAGATDPGSLSDPTLAVEATELGGTLAADGLAPDAVHPAPRRVISSRAPGARTIGIGLSPVESLEAAMLRVRPSWRPPPAGALHSHACPMAMATPCS